jgi:hypothetical protein
MRKLTLVNYAGSDDAELDARRHFCQSEMNSSAPIAGITQIESWSRSRLREVRFYDDNREMLDRPRGGGCWLWKPRMIQGAPNSADADDVIY